MKENSSKINSWITGLLVCLILFLPLSAWLISLSGIVNLTLIRDLLIIVIFVLSFFAVKNKNSNSVIIFSAIFIIYGLLTFFWREASVLQWLKGFRFTFGPILLFVSLARVKFSGQQLKNILWAVLIGAIFVSLLGILEFFGFKIPITTALSGAGALAATEKVVSNNLVLTRLESVLDGPNALGFYLLGIIAFCFGAFKKINPKLTFLVIIFGALLLFTFSRSSLVGLLVLILLALFISLRKSLGTKIAVRSLVLILILISVVVYFGFYKSNHFAKYEGFITHGDSSSLRVQQYKRIWNEKYQIGLFGRGSGTAGPSSQNRLDGGPNHWTENIYLDIFEELGVVGLLIYLALIVMFLRASWQRISDPIGKTAFLLVASFSVAGLFINYYTGQVGIFLFWLASALALNFETENKNEYRLLKKTKV